MKKTWLIIGVIIFVVLFERILSSTSLLNRLELFTYDMRSKLALDNGPFNSKFSHADQNIVIVLFDDYSRKEIAKNPQLGLGAWPWKRGVWGDVVDFIEQGKPKMILFDLIFNELNDNPLNDKKFASTLKKYDNVVLATSLNDPEYLVTEENRHLVKNSYYKPTKRPLDITFHGRNTSIEEKIAYHSHAPVHNLYTKHNTMAVVNKVVGEDSVIRRSQPIFKLIKDDKVYYMPSLSFSGFLKYMGEDGKIDVKNNKIRYKGRVIPIDDNGEVNISWHGKGKDYPQKPISIIILSLKNHKHIQPDFFKDKIVIIGSIEAGRDIHPSAVHPSFGGPESNAVALDNFINDSNPSSPMARKFLVKTQPRTSFLITLFFCLGLVALGAISKNAFVCFVTSSLLLILYVLFCLWAFVHPNIRIWVPMVIPMYYLIATSAIVFAYRFQKELAKRTAVTNAFGKFVSPKVLANLLKDEENLTLKSTKKRITMMFCDVKGFTTLSEKCDPVELLNGLNELFNELVEVIFSNEGTVDKFMGDCIMAYWGDPIAHQDDSYMAVKTALEIKKKVRELAQKNEKEGKIAFDVKIGINTGDALLGLAGSEKIMSYTAMGDVVNVAARLESNCSKLDRDVLISKTTYAEIKGRIIAEKAGKIKLKGKDERIEVYEPLGFAGEVILEEKKQ